jgi:hypothetical protein
VESAVRTSRLASLLALAASLLLSAATAGAQDPPATSAADGASLPPEHQEELDQLLLLTLPQQKERAKELIAAHPGTDLARILQRLLDEYAVFDQIEESESQARAARSAWIREYWRSRCCPPLQWSPPVGRLSNATGEPVLYQIRLLGIERTLWMGPYRMRVGASYESPTSYIVRYLTAAGMQEQLIVPGESYVFQGDPGAGTLLLAAPPIATEAVVTPALPMP